jgi:hypothetical protein
MANYSLSSPYYATPQTAGYLDVMTFRDIPVQSDDVLFVLTKNYEYRPELLANDLYGDVNLWWIFAVRNKSVIQDPIFDMTAGTAIYLPRLTTLKSVLGI